MSAGTGISHSEYNDSSTDDSVNFLQIWILPKKRNIEPRYAKKAIDNKSFNSIDIFYNRDAMALSDIKKIEPWHRPHEGAL